MALLSVMLGACSSVPDVVNPVSWYEKTTDFFSGDSQASATAPTTPDGQNQGLSADPNAPPPSPSPAPSQDVAMAPSGLSADQVGGNYASPPIERQGAPTNVLTPQAAVAQAPQAAPAPMPAPQPSVAVAPVQQPTMPAPVPSAPMTMASAPPPMPTMPSTTGAPALSASEAPTGPMTPLPPFEFPPASAMNAYGGDGFQTVVITADGMEAMAEPAPTPQLSMSGAPTSAAQSSGAAMFPEPGATVGGDVGPAMVGGMVRVATIHFANNAANLDQRDRSILGAVIQLQKERGGRVVVVGHASSRTKDMDYIKHQMVNFEISMNRAGVIGTALKNLGLPAETLEVQAVSDTQPLFLEVMPSGEAGNRRVEIYLAAAAT
ncbi:OmpA family protein [Magnetovibrio sp.]|uniref:OmpA family protein n=1 Tax=Magnetovibrio sp. TaxID=2024836 RepID=UPI002F949A45